MTEFLTYQASFYFLPHFRFSIVWQHWESAAFFTFFGIELLYTVEYSSKNLSKMHIFLRSQNLHTVDIENGTVYSLKKFLEKEEGLCAEEQILYYAGNPLEDDLEINSCLADGATVDVSVRLRGGKVHGSLARAGKVKGQTPKVEKQEKRKKKTGRAKRRMQFNKRFVNVVVTFGRKKGPNSNS
ncbi:40S ribosomal protein S30 [Nephila pilipes]|uniref:40S ribosomal protein S30 n=1 Tax=Nephila pilipes TaxID=299642 RepID=A0A8X6NRK6_NEPPI|nr:40S ribosomal protein S30 [Nephila pilipes]